MFLPQFIQPTAGNRNPSQPNMVPVTMYNQQMQIQQTSSTTMSLNLGSQTYSPTARPVMMPDMITNPPKLEDAHGPVGGPSDGGACDGRGLRPIGMERSLKAPPFVHTAGIWSTDPSGMPSTLTNA